MKKKLFFLTTILSLGLLSGCDENEYMLDDPSSVTPTIEIAEEDMVVQGNNGATIQLKATITNPSGIESVSLVSPGLGLDETINVNAPTYTLSKDLAIPASTQEGLYVVSITANSKNLITLTKEIKVFVGNASDDTAPVLKLLTDTEQQFKSTVDFELKITDNLGLKSIKVWSDDSEAIKDSIDLDGIAEYTYHNQFTLPASYMAKTVVIKAEAIDLFGNTTAIEPTTFKVNVLPEELYLIGGATDAGWEPVDAIPFNWISEGNFEVIANLKSDGYGFKFIGAKDYDHGVWGFEVERTELLEDGFVGQLYESTGSQNITPVEDPGLYKITVDIENLTFSINKITYPEELFLVGGSSEADWNENNALPFTKLDLGKFRIFTYLVAADGGVKFLPQKGSWANDWGMVPEESGSLIVEGEDNVSVPEDGFYAIEVDFNTMSYELIEMPFAIMGGFNTWTEEEPMNFDPVKGNYEFTLTKAFIEPTEFKFKWNVPGNWDYNFGSATGNGLTGEAVFNSPNNIKIPEPGTYDIVLNLNPEGYTFSVTKE